MLIAGLKLWESLRVKMPRSSLVMNVNFSGSFEIYWKSGVSVAELSIFDIKYHDLAHARRRQKILGIFVCKNVYKQSSNEGQMKEAFELIQKL